MTFEPSAFNPELAAINNQYFSLFDNNSGGEVIGVGPDFFGGFDEGGPVPQAC